MINRSDSYLYSNALLDLALLDRELAKLRRSTGNTYFLDARFLLSAATEPRVPGAVAN